MGLNEVGPAGSQVGGLFYFATEASGRNNRAMKFSALGDAAVVVDFGSHGEGRGTEFAAGDDGGGGGVADAARRAGGGGTTH